MKSDILRQRFLDFFKAKKHKIVDSDSLVPKDDATVLFTPAGMNQFKKQFLGHLTGFSRAATSQRCLRTDDLDRVGKTPGHHTFFEMLGNFSFGDYFKKEAIAWAWEFLTEELKIAEDKLWVSIYKDDDEAYKIWKNKIKVPENKIIRLGDKENFWPSEAKANGPNGPCGPCSEIFFDQGDIVPGCGRPDCGPSCNCGRFVEVWNLVFTQFNRKEGGTLEPLPKKNIDTGMGLERLAAVMQGKPNNFETDLFEPLIKEITMNVQNKNKELIYAVADHLRAIIFAIYDEVLPSNEGRGYVVRKLIRKSTLHLRSLGIANPFLYKLVPVASETMKVPYPDLDKRKENIAQIILAEEKNFIYILNSSDKLSEESYKLFLGPYKDSLDKAKDRDEFDKILISGSGHAGEIAFLLYDTHGIPPESPLAYLNKYVKISEKAYSEKFDKGLQEQKNRSKLQSTMKGDVFDIKELHLAGAKTNFLGYTKYEAKAKILKIIKDSTLVKKANKGEEAKIILDKTVFYPESGGQVGDTGELINPVRNTKALTGKHKISNGVKGKNIFLVTDTQKFDKVIVHKGIVKEGSFKSGDELKSCIDIERRLSIARNHTATHLLHSALRMVLGIHVRQQGSLVAEDRLRFDFTHFKDLTFEQIDRIEEVVNEYVLRNQCLSVEEVPLSVAKKSGALAFFGEKYEGRVRVISVGDFSKELCGGTHLDSAGQIGLFKIINEGSVASGVRRIEAVTGESAYRTIKEQENILTDVSSILNVPTQNVMQELQKKLAQIKELEKKLNLQRLDIIKSSLDGIIQEAQNIKDIKIITKIIENMDMDLLRKTVDLIKKRMDNAVIALGSVLDGRALLVMGITPDLIIRGLDASILIRDVAKVIGGSGGGRKDFAQAGGNRPENLKTAFQELKNIIGNLK